MPAHRRIADVQLEELVAWMESHPQQARATQINSLQAKQLTHRLWDDLASRINAVGNGATKTAKEWRKYWSDLKSKVRKKGSDMRQHARGTGGGPSWNGFLTPMEERILAIMGVENVMGNENVRLEIDMGLDDTPPQPAPSSCPVTPVSGESTPHIGNHLTPQGKRRHVAVAGSAADDEPAERARPLMAPARWALDLEERRIHEEQIRRDLEERRVRIEERRLALDEVRVSLEKARLSIEKKRLEEDRIWRKDVLESLSKISKSLGDGT